MDAVGLELYNADSNDELEIHVDPGYPTGFSDVETEEIDVSIELAEALDGPAVREFEVIDPATGKPSVDRITVQIFDATDSLDPEFQFADLMPAHVGDSYYLRVTQIDGERAWSSPWWIAGRDPDQRLPVTGRASGQRRSTR
jgi:hypothetical protein